MVLARLQPFELVRRRPRDRAGRGPRDAGVASVESFRNTLRQDVGRFQHGRRVPADDRALRGHRRPHGAQTAHDRPVGALVLRRLPESCLLEVCRTDGVALRRPRRFRSRHGLLLRCLHRGGVACGLGIYRSLVVHGRPAVLRPGCVGASGTCRHRCESGQRDAAPIDLVSGSPSVPFGHLRPRHRTEARDARAATCRCRAAPRVRLA